MALIRCVECEKQVSTLADACPHCGAPVRHSVKAVEEESHEEERDRSGFILKLFLLVVILGLGYLLGKKHVDPVLLKIKDRIVSKASSSQTQEPVASAIGGSGVNPTGVSESGGVLEAVESDNTGELAGQSDPDPMGDALENDSSSEGSATHQSQEVVEPASVKPSEEEKSNTIETSSAEKQEAKAQVPEEGGSKSPANSSPKTEKVVEVVAEEDAVEPVKERLNELLEKAGKLKVKIVSKLTLDEEGMLVVTVNQNWPLLSLDQKQESTQEVYDLWQEINGGRVEYRNAKGNVVASMDLTSQMIRGRVTFAIEDGQ